MDKRLQTYDDKFEGKIITTIFQSKAVHPRTGQYTETLFCSAIKWEKTNNLSAQVQTVASLKYIKICYYSATTSVTLVMPLLPPPSSATMGPPPQVRTRICHSTQQLVLYSSNSTYSISCGFVVQQAVQQIHNKSNKWSLSLRAHLEFCKSRVKHSNFLLFQIHDLGRPYTEKFFYVDFSNLTKLF